MSLYVDIKKQLEAYRLELQFESASKRLGILGESGAGKSMTLKCIAGIETPDSGQIILDTTTVYDKNKRIDRRPQERSIGYLFQNYALFPTMSVEKNIGAGLKGDRREKEERIRKMVQKFHLEGLEKRLPGELSGGQKQRTALARIMAYEPDMLLLDEPFSALDRELKEELMRELKEMLQDYEGTMILVSHSLEELACFSEELLVIRQGKKEIFGKTEEVLQRMAEEKEFTHFNDQGYARMVSVGEKPVTERTAVAEGFIKVSPETLRLVKTGGIKKGDVLTVAQIAGIMGAKKTSELIPMCHPMLLDGIDLSFEPDEVRSQIRILAKVSCSGKTGVEMEALTAVSAAALTIYDMCKAVQKDMEITDIRLLNKTGGVHGDFVRETKEPENR